MIEKHAICDRCGHRIPFPEFEHQLVSQHRWLIVQDRCKRESYYYCPPCAHAFWQTMKPCKAFVRAIRGSCAGGCTT